ncbi:MAG TPA: hypothetical protein VGM86_19285, partial [Thermoanaerobaculia bacterium]
RPVTPAELSSRLDPYAGVWALAATVCVREGVRALRRAARTTAHQGEAFKESQLVALGVAEVEIEAELTAVAVRASLALDPRDPARAGGFLLAAAAARSLAALAARAAELYDRMGVVPGDPWDGAAPALTAYLGGPPRLENEVAHALGIPPWERER